jgi:hypothetical protein
MIQLTINQSLGQSLIEDGLTVSDDIHYTNIKVFHIDVTFEMKAVHFTQMHLFN